MSDKIYHLWRWKHTITQGWRIWRSIKVNLEACQSNHTMGLSRRLRQPPLPAKLVSAATLLNSRVDVDMEKLYSIAFRQVHIFFVHTSWLHSWIYTYLSCNNTIYVRKYILLLLLFTLNCIYLDTGQLQHGDLYSSLLWRRCVRLIQCISSHCSISTTSSTWQSVMRRNRQIWIKG